ncbi:MAG: TetR/AcrR family transcriptional regulator [Burkholderiaceae bacterium]
MSYHHGDLKSALLDRAEDVIAEHGLEAVKLSSLARDLGVSHSAPGRHFKDRMALLVELAIRALEMLMHDINDAKGMSDPSPRVRLNTLLKVQIESVIKRPAHYYLLGSAEISLAAGERYDTMIAAYTELHQRCTRDAQADGWRADENADDVAILALALTIGLQTNAHFSRKAKGKLTRNTLVKGTKDVRNVLKAIDLFIPCEGPAGNGD